MTPDAMILWCVPANFFGWLNRIFTPISFHDVEKSDTVSSCIQTPAHAREPVTDIDVSPPLVLDQWHHLGGKALHPLQRLLDGGIWATDRRPARRSAAGLSPPTQMGGCGRCTGLGANRTCAKRQYVPSNVGVSCVHSSRKARIYSLLTAPRSSNGGAAMATNSSRIHPTPHPTMTRPWESTSIVASIFAVSTGGRCGRTRTAVSSFAEGVMPARKLSSASGFRYSPFASAPASNCPLAL